MRTISCRAILIAAVLTIATTQAQAQPYEINWYTIDGGGGTSSGGGFTLSGTIGQADAAQGLSGGGYTLDSGFWPGVLALPPACEADLNGDGFLDLGDINFFVALFLDGNLAADTNGDGFLDLGDINTFVALFLAGC